MRGRAKVVPTLLVLLVFSFCLPCVRGSSGYVDVTVSEAKNMIDSNPLLVILDVRTQSEYDSGHIRNAKLIPHTELEARISELDENRETLVYCRSGQRSAIASQILVDHGFSKVHNMLGGILAWIGADYSVYVRYTSIQHVINNASDGDTIFVSSGTYLQHLVLNKSLTLVGENRDTTIIDGGGAGNVVLATANNTAVNDFTIQGSGCGCADFSGIILADTHNSNVTGNIVKNNGYGIYLDNSTGCIVSGNTITNNEWSGIGLESSHRNNVACNDVRKNFLGGINSIYSSDNVFILNNIVDNIPQTDVLGGNAGIWDDGYPSGGNYWSDYAGVDSNGDGIGDTPYTIDDNNQDNFPLMTPYIPPKELLVLHYELLEKYNRLLADYDALNTSYNSLSSSYNNLNTTYNELKSKQETTINEVNTIRNLMYIFIATTIIFIATTAYFVRGKPKS